MAIATITPQNRTQVNLLAQALNGSSGSLAQALNSAIQRSALDMQIQQQQGQTMIREQSKNMDRHQRERFDLRNRTENAFQMQQTQQNNDVINAGRVQDQEFKSENQGFLRSEREIAQSTGSTQAGMNAFRYGNEVNDDAKLRANNADDASVKVDDVNYERSERAKLAKANLSPADQTIKKDRQSDEDRVFEMEEKGQNSDIRAIKLNKILNGESNLVDRNDFVYDTLNDDTWGDVKTLSNAQLKGAIEAHNSSELGKTPDAILKRNEFESELNSRIKAQEQNKTTNKEFKNADDARAFANRLKSNIEGFDKVDFGGDLNDFAMGFDTPEQFHNALVTKGVDIKSTDAKKLYEAEKAIYSYQKELNDAAKKATGGLSPKPPKK